MVDERDTQQDFKTPSMDRSQQRYARHFALKEIGAKGQALYAQSHVMIVGLGGLGCIIAPYLAAAGIGHLTLVDFDQVSLSNLQRQPLYHEQDVGRLKVNVARERLQAQNSEIQIDSFATSLEELYIAWALAPNLSEQQNEVNRLNPFLKLDLIVDATDRLATRDLICDISHHFAIPHIYGSVNGFEGQLALFRPEESCYRCLFPKLPRAGLIQNCAQAGVLGAAPAFIGSAQALLCLRELSQVTVSARDTLTSFDLLSFSSYQLPLSRSETCPYHGSQPKEDPVVPRSFPISPYTLMKRWQRGWRPFIFDVREQIELTSGMIDTAQHWPLSVLKTQVAVELSTKLGELDQEVEQKAQAVDILFYCEQGPRAEQAAHYVLEALCTLQISIDPIEFKCWELVGGWKGWHEEGHRLLSSKSESETNFL